MANFPLRRPPGNIALLGLHQVKMAMSSFGVEVWAKYGVAVAVMALRFVTRWRLIGWRNFDGTDLWCAISAVSEAVLK